MPAKNPNAVWSNVMGNALAQLGGATRGFIFTSHADAYLAVTKLMLCQEHHGTHHFAVVNEGNGVYMSGTGAQCLIDQGIPLPTIAQDVTT